MRALFLVAAPLAACAGDRPPPVAAGKNLLLVTLDTTRADFVSCLGGDPGTTPSIDALAARSTLFTAGTSETNVTNPSHLTILTGLRAIEHGVINNRTAIPAELDTLAAAFRRAGCDTAAFVAARHLGPTAGWRDFDALPEAQLRSGRPVDAAVITDRALRWLGEEGRGRFFVWVHYFDPHWSYQAPADVARRFYRGDPEAGSGPTIASAPWFEHDRTAVLWLRDARDPEYPRAMYAAEVHYADREIGRLLAGMRDLGLEPETVVVLAADHGESLGEHGIYYSHEGLYEEQLRIPLVVHVPGLAPSVSGERVSTLDIAPTVAELFGLELAQPMTGLSLVPLLMGRPSPAVAGRPALIHQNAHNHAVAARQGPWKLIWPIGEADPFLAGPPELYHLGDDPHELCDLAAVHPDRVEALRALVEPWIELGPVAPGDGAHLDPEILGELEALGYADR